MNPNEQPYNPQPQVPQQPLTPEPQVSVEPPITPVTPGQPTIPVAPQPDLAPTPQVQIPVTPPAPTQPLAPEPVIQPVQQPVTDTMPMSYEQAAAPTGGGLLGMLNERAGLFSLIVFAIAFIALSVATMLDINNGLSALADFTAALGGNLELPSFFEVTKTAITHWEFVNIISTWWWVAGLLPALALAGYGLFKKRFKDIPAVITVVLVLEVYLNLIIK